MDNQFAKFVFLKPFNDLDIKFKFTSRNPRSKGKMHNLKSIYSNIHI